MKITNRWVVFFVLLPHLSIYYLRLGLLEPITLALQFLTVFLACVIILKTQKLSNFNALLSLCMIVTVIISAINGVVTVGIIYTAIVFIGFCVYISYAANDFRELISGLYYLSVVVVLGSLITLVFPSHNALSGETVYFLGGKNQIAMTMVPVFAICYLYSIITYRKVKPLPFLIMITGLIITYITGSGTGIVAALLVILFLLMPFRNYPSFKTYLLITIGVFLCISIFRLQEVLFGDFIVGYLGKDLTLTHRTDIWDVVIQNFKDNWLIGSGRGNSLIAENILYLNVNEAHNGFLQILLDSGVIGLGIVLLLLLMISKKIKKHKGTFISDVLSFSIFAFLIIGLTESAYFRKEFWILLVIASCLDTISSQYEKDELKLEIKERPRKKKIKIVW